MKVFPHTFPFFLLLPFIFFHLSICRIQKETIQIQGQVKGVRMTRLILQIFQVLNLPRNHQAIDQKDLFAPIVNR